MKDGKRELSAKDLYFLKKHLVVIEDFNADGFILDIGGGGEGVIGQLKGKQVIAIDSNQNELLEAADGPLKIVMDAKHLKFFDSTFNLVTAFYSLMYMTTKDHKRVFGEVFRVLKEKGIFKIWDVQLTRRESVDKPGFAVPVEVILPNIKINTCYGSCWLKESYDLDYYIEIARSTGFSIVVKNQRNDSFSLFLRK
jgi:ubiquinone/menaquinone biosynthesis C-methylase UbiE